MRVGGRISSAGPSWARGRQLAGTSDRWVGAGDGGDDHEIPNESSANRVTPNGYTTFEDVDAFVCAIESIATKRIL